MSDIEQKDRRFKNLELKVGVLVATALAGILFIIVLIGIEKDLFTPKYTVYLVSGSGAGFVEGMPVKLSGFKIGRVKRLELTPEGRVKVTLEINKRYDMWLRETSTAGLSKEGGLIGDSFVEIKTEGASGRKLGSGEMIAFERTRGVEDLVAEAKPVLKEIKEIIHYANDPKGDLKSSINNIKELASELRETRKAFEATLDKTGALVDRVDEKSGPLMENAGHAIRNIDVFTTRLEPVIFKLENVASKASEAAEMLPETVGKIDSIMDGVKKVTDTLSGETPRIREILSNTDEAARDSRIILRGVKTSWPVRLMAPEPRTPALVPLDSFLLKRKGDEKR